MLKEIKDINKFAKIHHKRVIMKGYWREEREFGTLLMLIATEINKLYSDMTINKPEKLADIGLRILDLMGKYNYTMDMTYFELTKLSYLYEEHQMIRDLTDAMEIYRLTGKKDCLPLFRLLRRCYTYAFYNEINLNKEMARKSRMIFGIKKKVV